MKEDEKIIETGNEAMKQEEPSWHCDIYCRKVRHVTCEGRAHADDKSENRCPYLDEMLY